jgi:hypothetical protein
MRKLVPLLVVGFLFSGLALLRADEGGKKVTLTGEGQCAKCSLKETPSCQNAVVVTDKDGKKTTYYLAKNELSNGFHRNLCQTVRKVKVEGTCEKKDDKLVVTATKIEIAKD